MEYILEAMQHLSTANYNSLFRLKEELSLSQVLTKSGLKQERGGPEMPGGRGWGWSTSWRPCSTTAWVPSHSLTTSPPAAGWALRSTSTTVRWSATTTTPWRR